MSGKEKRPRITRGLLAFAECTSETCRTIPVDQSFPLDHFVGEQELIFLAFEPDCIRTEPFLRHPDLFRLEITELELPVGERFGRSEDDSVFDYPATAGLGAAEV